MFKVTDQDKLIVLQNILWFPYMTYTGKYDSNKIWEIRMHQHGRVIVMLPINSHMKADMSAILQHKDKKGRLECLNNQVLQFNGMPNKTIHIEPLHKHDLVQQYYHMVSVSQNKQHPSSILPK